MMCSYAQWALPAHNDAQCGNLLRLTPGGKDEMVAGLRFPHEMIIVV